METGALFKVLQINIAIFVFMIFIAPALAGNNIMYVLCLLACAYGRALGKELNEL
jgi:hypothetical protein